MNKLDQNEHNGFWTSECRYGLIHQSNNAVSNRANVLLVYVHGLFGDAGLTWKHMPAWVLERAKTDMAVISYAYPTQIWQRTSIDEAAHDLKTWIESEFVDFQHLLFVTHSTGGIVVKKMLVDSFQHSSVSTIWQKTRQVVNIAVPHHGGSAYLTWGLNWIYQLLYPLFGPALIATRGGSQGKKDWGRNRIIPILQWNNAWLKQLENTFIQSFQTCYSDGIGRPGLVELVAESDESVRHVLDDHRMLIRLRGTHKSVKIPRRQNAPVVEIVADIVSQYTSSLDLTVAYFTMQRIRQVHEAARVQHLIGMADYDETVCMNKSRIFQRSGNQAEVCHLICKEINQRHERAHRMVVTGQAGVGKSTVVQEIAWRLAQQYLVRPNESALPLFIPLQQITGDFFEDQGLNWDSLWQWWLAWVQRLYPAEVCNMAWLQSKFRSDAVCIILDGVDDFLRNHADLNLSVIVRLFRKAAHEYADNHQFCMLAAIRHDCYGFERLADNPAMTYEVEAMNREQAIIHFPNCQGWLDTVQDPDLLAMVLTPLILNNYKPLPYRIKGELASSQAAILNQIIETFLRESQLLGRCFNDDEFIELEHVFIALALIAWLFFSQSRGEFQGLKLQSEVIQLKQRWKAFFQRQQNRREQQMFFYGLEILENQEFLQLLLNSGVFINTGLDNFRFVHRNWQELLLARFFLMCLNFQHFDEWGEAKLYSGIYRFAGEMYQQSAITEEQVTSVISCWHNTGNTLITANFIGYLSWTQTPMEVKAIESLLAEFPNLTGLSRVILVGGLGYRVLKNAAHDYSSHDLRRALLKSFFVISNPETCPIKAPVASSLAWCYQKAFASVFESAMPGCTWPEPGFDGEDSLAVVAMIASVEGNKVSLNSDSQVLQQALLTPIQDCFQFPEYIIRAVHYLYILVIAEYYQVHALSLSQELPVLLSADSEMAKRVEQFELVPELASLYRKCQQLHRHIVLNKT